MLVAAESNGGGGPLSPAACPSRPSSPAGSPAVTRASSNDQGAQVQGVVTQIYPFVNSRGLQIQAAMAANFNVGQGSLFHANLIDSLNAKLAAAESAQKSSAVADFLALWAPQSDAIIADLAQKKSEIEDIVARIKAALAFDNSDEALYATPEAQQVAAMLLACDAHSEFVAQVVNDVLGQVPE